MFGATGPVLVWQFEESVRSISSASVGGGWSRPRWIINLSVEGNYSRVDPEVHIAEVANELELLGHGVGLLTAVDVRTRTISEVEGAVVVATVGVRRPIWAHDASRALPERASKASKESSESSESSNPGQSNHSGQLSGTFPGTINLVCTVPQSLSDAALVNVISTVTEAKAQALFDHGIEGSGTASDAICVVCPEFALSKENFSDALFGGPLSYWGSRLARATYDAVSEGLLKQRTAHPEITS